MRYLNIDTITFVDSNNISRPVKDIRPLEDVDTWIELPLEEDVDIDELISRDEHFGPGSEDLLYTVADHNKIKLMESNFQIDKLKKIKLPVVQ